MAENTPSKDHKQQGVKHKAHKQKPLTKPIRPSGDYATKKMKAWDVIAKQTNHFNDGLKFEELDPHDGSNSNDKLDGKPLSNMLYQK